MRAEEVDFGADDYHAVHQLLRDLEDTHAMEGVAGRVRAVAFAMGAMCADLARVITADGGVGLNGPGVQPVQLREAIQHLSGAAALMRKSVGG